MLNFLPLIYEDELLYSVIARYRRMCGMLSKRALIRDMFGELYIINSSYFPQYIKAFVSNLPPTSRITTEEIIRNHTMFPFYTAFLSKEKTNLVYEVMENGGNGTHASIEKIIGMGGNKVKKANYLKYCPICFKKDMENMGESYWRTTHQLVGVMYCSKHGVLLKESSVLSTGSGVEFICADSEVCNEKVLPDPYSDRIKKMNLQYTMNAEKLIHENYPRKNLNDVIGFYIDRLRDKGLAAVSGNLYINEVQHHFMNYYTEPYLELMQSELNPDKPTNWLRLFVRSNNKNRSPLRHLLFLQFLGVSIDEFFSNEGIVGKRSISKQYTPSFSLNDRRAKWLKLIEENKGANRSQLKEIGKGLHSWIFRYDQEWYEEVTPKNLPRKKRTDTVDWEKRDEECLKLAKEAVKLILAKEGKPARITPLSIRRTIGAGRWFEKKKLVKTHKYLEEITEDINSFRIRKIKWAINEMIQNGLPLTPYKIQRYAGFDGNSEDVRGLVIEILNNTE